MTLGLKRPVVSVQELRRQRARREATGSGDKSGGKMPDAQTPAQKSADVKDLTDQEVYDRGLMTESEKKNFEGDWTK
eukprot:5702527-Amphidinium_carterae.1